MNILIFSIILLTIAHFFKVARQKQFIEIYEKPNEKYLLQGLSIGYILNIILPFKLGTLFRIVYPGKKMENGISFSLSTVIVDIILDFFLVLFIYFIFSLFGMNIGDNLIYYFIICSIIIIGLIFAVILNRFVKNIILKIASIFNDEIELKILKTFWFTIISFKDMITRINKIKLFIYTFLMWFLYLSSYYLLGIYFVKCGMNYDFLDIFNMFYSMTNLSVPTVTFVSYANTINITLLGIYIFVPIILLFTFSYLWNCNKKEKDNKKEYIKILPHINMQDRLSFLVAYFNADNRDYFKTYISSNNDVAVIEDFSAGSNATTMLCSKDGKTFFRKYSFGKDANKLNDQIKWLQSHQGIIKLTKLDNIKKDENYCSYDMPYNSNAITCFNYIHTVPTSESWPIIEKALDDIHFNLHTLNVKKSKKNIIEKYIDSKVLNNINQIENARYIKPLLKYDTLIINGKEYKNLKYFKKYLNKEYLYNVFKNDNYSDIHGDFTIENIICYKKNRREDDYYIIDPNTGNVHESPYLDFAKLLQSIHGGYEFLMNTKNVDIQNNKINYMFIKSSVYDELFLKYKKYLNNNFTKEAVKSIFFHEIIHWLRLLPYKIEKNGERCVLFYAGLIIVLNEIEEMIIKGNDNE